MRRSSFQSWEVPPGCELIPESVTHVRRRSNIGAPQWKIGLIKIPVERRPRLWVCPFGENLDAGFVAFSRDNLLTKRFDPATKWFDLRPEFVHLWEKNLFARLFFLNERGELRNEGEVAHESILVAPNGEAAWSQGLLVPQARDPSEFSWGLGLTNKEFLSLPAREVWDNIQHLLAEAEGDACFARHFALCDEAQRYALITGNSSRSVEEFKNRLRDLVLCQKFWEKVLPGTKFWLKAMDRNHIAYSSLSALPRHDSEFPLDLITKLWDWFQPVKPEVVERRCVQRWMNRREFGFEVSATDPSAHERLEAHLRWREWLAKTQEARK